METREETHRSLDAVLACCEATGLSLLLLYPAPESDDAGLEPLVGNRDTIEQLVRDCEGSGAWLMLDGVLVLEPLEPVPLARLGQQ